MVEATQRQCKDGLDLMGSLLHGDLGMIFIPTSSSSSFASIGWNSGVQAQDFGSDSAMLHAVLAVLVLSLAVLILLCLLFSAGPSLSQDTAHKKASSLLGTWWKSRRTELQAVVDWAAWERACPKLSISGAFQSFCIRFGSSVFSSGRREHLQHLPGRHGAGRSSAASQLWTPFPCSWAP